MGVSRGSWCMAAPSANGRSNSRQKWEWSVPRAWSHAQKNSFGERGGRPLELRSQSLWRSATPLGARSGRLLRMRAA